MVRMDTKLSTEEHVMNGTRHTGTSVAVYKDLKEQILHLELPPGSAISEIDTAAAFHVSRTPVRDAFKMLARGASGGPPAHRYIRLPDRPQHDLRHSLSEGDLRAGGVKRSDRRVRQIPGIPHPPAVAAPMRTSGTGSARRGTRPGLHH